MTDREYAEDIDPEQYCSHLKNPPAKNVKYQCSSKFYICNFTEKPCVAREIEDRTYEGDILDYSYPVINIDLLKSCPANNISKEVAKAVINDRIKRQISELEKKIL